MNQNIQQQIAKLPASEQLEIATYIYNSLAATGQLLTPEQIEETKRRAKQIDEDPQSLLTTEQMWSKVNRLRSERKN